MFRRSFFITLIDFEENIKIKKKIKSSNYSMIVWMIEKTVIHINIILILKEK